MFNPFGKKKTSEVDEAVAAAQQEEEDAAKEEKKEEKTAVSGNASADVLRLATEIDRIKISVEGFTEVRKSFTDRFTRISEQIGELRSMILERDKSIQEIELKAIKAHDLVESVHPEKIMTEVQKQDAKIEALKANLEGNESIMGRIMEELKEAKRKIEFFRGVEEIVKLSEEVKQELIEIKKVESKISINADKVETLYSEIRKKFQDIDSFNSELTELKVLTEQNSKDANFLKDKISRMADKDELNNLVNKVQRYVDALKELEKKSSLSKDISTLRTLLDGLK
jgi:DNA repair exonuclease SbcCD ATPase subunit